jgi:transcriptional repressor NrdR
MPRIIKGNGAREPFDEKKLVGGMMRALEKRPVDTDSVAAAISRLQHRLRASGEREIPARMLGEWVMNELRQLDQVAYVRFASVYRSFQDVSQFREEVERLQQQPTPEERRNQMKLLPDEDESDEI